MSIHFKAAAKRRDGEHNDRAWLAWNTVALDRQKRLPDLRRLMITEQPKPKRKQTWQEQFAIMEQWGSAMRRRKKPRG